MSEFRLPYVLPIVKPNRPLPQTTLGVAFGGCAYPRNLPGLKWFRGLTLASALIGLRWAGDGIGNSRVLGNGVGARYNPG